MPLQNARRHNAVAAATLGALIAAVPASTARAVDRYWVTETGLWSQPGNWTGGIVPGPPDHAIIDYFGNGTAGLARINTTAIGAVSYVTILNGGTVRISNQGSLLCGADFIVGQSNTQGTLNVLTTNPDIGFPGGLTVAGNLRLGVLSGVGHVNHNAGTVAVGNAVVLGDSRDFSSAFNSVGTYTLGGTGRLRAPQLWVGHASSSIGILNLSGFATAQLDALDVGYINAIGVVNQTGGNMIAGVTRIAPSTISSPDPISTYNLGGGIFNSIETTIYRGGRFNYTGGTASLGDLWIGDGRIALSSGGGKVLRAKTLSVLYDEGVIDLSDNRMVIENGDWYDVRAEIRRGYNGGDWTGVGITSSAAAAVAASGSPRRTALGYGFEVEGLVVQYTYAGDANLDGVVNLQDFNRLAANFGTSQLWGWGDFNYDGMVNLQDFNLLAANFGLSATGPEVTPDDWATLAGLIPEPTSALSLSGVAASAVLLRRRRRK